MLLLRLQRARSYAEEVERRLLRAYARYRKKRRSKNKKRGWKQESRLLGQKRQSLLPVPLFTHLPMRNCIRKGSGSCSGASIFGPQSSGNGASSTRFVDL